MQISDALLGAAALQHARIDFRSQLVAVRSGIGAQRMAGPLLVEGVIDVGAECEWPLIRRFPSDATLSAA